MKMIIAIIKPNKLEEVINQLYKADVNLLTVSEVLGHGRQKGVTEVRNRNYILPRIKIL